MSLLLQPALVLAVLACACGVGVAAPSGFDPEPWLEDLGQIREVGVISRAAGEGKFPKLQMTLSRLTADQRRLYEALNLGRYASS